jgi:hypothetical protein
MIAIEKIVLIIIFLIVLLICFFVLFGFVIPSGKQIDVQNQVRQCCTLYRAKGCPTDIVEVTNTLCEGSSLKTLIEKVPMDINQLKAFCGC